MSALRRIVGVLSAVVLAAGSAGIAGAAGQRYEDAARGFAVELPEGWRLFKLDVDPGNEAPIGFASPESMRAAKEKGQPFFNPRYQAVLLAVLPSEPFPELARRYCRNASGPTAVTDRTVDGAPAIACDGTRAVGGDVQLPVDTRNVFIRTPLGVLHLYAESKTGAPTPGGADALTVLLPGFHVLAPGARPAAAPTPRSISSRALVIEATGQPRAFL